MKKVLFLFLISAFLFSFAACASSEPADNGQRDTANPYFTGKVLEVYEAGCLVEVTDIGNGHFWVGEIVNVHTNIPACPQYAVGDFLRISFDGKVATSYPPQVTNVFIISKVNAS